MSLNIITIDTNSNFEILPQMRFIIVKTSCFADLRNALGKVKTILINCELVARYYIIMIYYYALFNCCERLYFVLIRRSEVVVMFTSGRQMRDNQNIIQLLKLLELEVI